MESTPAFRAGLAVCTVSIVGAIVFSLFRDEPNAVDIVEPSKLEQASTLEVAPEDSLPVKAQELPGTLKDDQGTDFNPEMKARLQTISEAYEEKVRFPSFSQPIKPGELEGKYLPNIPIANELPARLTDPDSPSLSIKTGKYRYFSGDLITATAQISGIEIHESSAARARLISGGDILAHGIVSTNEETTHTFDISFDHFDIPQETTNTELNLEVDFEFLGQKYQRGISIEYITAIANLEEVAPAVVESEYLSIPVYVSTEKPGYHRVRGNLYDLETDTPLIHLRAEELLTSNQGTLYLKAHIAALKEAGSEGPYELRNLSLQRLPSDPDYLTEFGSLSQDSFKVEGFGFSEYQDVPFIDEKAQRIAKELRRLGS